MVCSGGRTGLSLIACATVFPVRSQRYSQLRETAADRDEPDVAVGGQGENINRGGGGGRGARKTFPVSAGRMPVYEVLLSEQENAAREGIDRVKVSPAALSCAVLALEMRRSSSCVRYLTLTSYNRIPLTERPRARRALPVLVRFHPP